MQKQLSWFKQTKIWLTGLIALFILAACLIGVNEWRQMEQEQQDARIRKVENQLVQELVQHYSGVKAVRFESVGYNPMTGGTTYTFHVNGQEELTSYSADGEPGYLEDKPEIRYSEKFFETNEREPPLAASAVKINQVQIHYQTKSRKE